MAESMQGLKRSCRCAETSSQDIGKTVTVMGWVQRRILYYCEQAPILSAKADYLI